MALIVLIGIGLNLVFVAGSCPAEFIEESSNCYYFSTEVEEWVNAKHICKLFFGAKLVEINDAEEDAIITRAAKLNQATYWLGSNDIQQEGTWKFASSNQEMTYTNWGPGEPNNYKQSEDCLAMSNTIGWVDVPCNVPMTYACEKPAAIDL